MRRLLCILALLLALPVAAQKAAPPPGLQPIPEPPPSPQDMALDPALEPQVTITKRGEDKVEEFRVNGQLYALRVTPPHGISYWLMDATGDGTMMRRDSLDTGLRVPQWVIHSF